MREMTDSGVKWIGEVPSHWKICYPKALFTQRRERARKADEQLTASQTYGIISQKTFEELEGRRVVQVALNREILKHVESGDFVITMRSFQGGLELAEISGCISSAYVMITPRNKGVFPGYFRHLFKSPHYIDALRSTSNLIRDGQALRFANFVQIDLPLPPFDEQCRIADYLDERCGAIDEAKRAIEAEVDALKRLKKATIFKAVAKGLDDGVPMCGSGIDWIPEIPTNWHVMPYKHVFKEVERPARDDDEVITCFRDGEVTLRKNRREDGFTVAEQESGYQHISKGDLVVHGMDGFAGAIGISDSDGKATPVLIVINPLHAECSRYFMYQLRAYANLEVFLATATGIRVRSCSLNWKKLGNLPALVPPSEEQQKIADYLDERCTAIDSIVDVRTKQLERLEDYRKALIYAYVTGKKEVPTS